MFFAYTWLEVGHTQERYASLRISFDRIGNSLPRLRELTWCGHAVSKRIICGDCIDLESEIGRAIDCYIGLWFYTNDGIHHKPTNAETRRTPPSALPWSRPHQTCEFCLVEVWWTWVFGRVILHRCRCDSGQTVVIRINISGNLFLLWWWMTWLLGSFQTASEN